MGKQLLGTGERVTEACPCRAFSPTCPVFPSSSSQNTVGQELIFKEFTHGNSKKEKLLISVQRHSIQLLFFCIILKNVIEISAWN